MTFSLSLSETKKAAKALQTRWKDPVVFARELFGLELWDWGPDRPVHGRASQAELCRAVATHSQVAVRSGQKTGKSISIALLAFWHCMLHERGKVVLTAPTGHQIGHILWPEIRSLYSRAKYPIGGKLHLDPFSGFELPGERGIICISTDKPEKLSGISGPNNLYCVDEGSGYPEPLWEAVQGNLAGGGKLFTPGNPTKTSGKFHDIFARDAQSWKRLHLSSEDTPNARSGKILVPGLATQQWLGEREIEWGRGSAAFASRVLGEFPIQGDDAVISIAVVDAAQARFNSTVGAGPLQIGVDVARFGDDESVFTPRRGQAVLAVPVAEYACQGKDVVEVAGRVTALAQKLKLPNERPLIVVDEGGVGGGVVDTLKRVEWLDVIGVNAGERATADGYSKLRDQLWFSASNWLAEGGAIPDDPKLYSELVAPTYTFDAQGRRKVESKDETKKSLHRSPDRADSLCLAIYQPPRITDVELFTISSRC